MDDPRQILSEAGVECAEGEVRLATTITGFAIVTMLCWAAVWFTIRLAFDEWREPVIGPGRSFAVFTLLLAVGIAAIPVLFMMALVMRMT